MAFLSAIKCGKIEQHFYVETITEHEKITARYNFDVYKEKGVISGEFDDSKWRITNQAKTLAISFDVFNESSFSNQRNTTFEQFVQDVKYYIALCIGKYTVDLYPRSEEDLPIILYKI